MARKQSVTDAANLSERDVNALWAKYRSHPKCVKLRDKLVEHYFPWFRTMATGAARKMNLPDVENAVGEACLTLTTRIIPAYNGKSPFENFAAVCVKNLYRSIHRHKREPETISLDGINGLKFFSGINNVEVEADIQQLTAFLPHSQAIIIWLRFSRGMTIGQTADFLNIPTGTVKSRTSTAMKTIRNRVKSSEFTA